MELPSRTNVASGRRRRRRLLKLARTLGAYCSLGSAKSCQLQATYADTPSLAPGCIWACPYEYRFYDFSDPMSCWPELETGKCMYGDSMEPTFEADGSIKCYQAEPSADDEDEDEEETVPKRPVGIAPFTRFKREGLKLVEVEAWVSDAEKDRRVKREEYERKNEEWTRNFKNTDPLYLAYVELVKDPALSPDAYEAVGRIYEDWSKVYTRPMVGERRWRRRIVYQSRESGKGYTVDLEWGVEAGPIKLVIFKDGKTFGDKWFEHSVSAMREAFAYVKSLIAGPS